MSRRAITDEQRIDAYLDTATRDQLVRLQSDVNAALRWRFPALFTKEEPKRPRRKADAQLPLAAKVE